MATGEIPQFSDAEIGRSIFETVEALRNEDIGIRTMMGISMNVERRQYDVFTLDGIEQLSAFLDYRRIVLEESQYGTFYRHVADIRATIPPAYKYFTQMMLPPDMVEASVDVVKEWLDNCEIHGQRLARIAQEKGIRVETLVNNPNWVFEQALTNMGINLNNK